MLLSTSLDIDGVIAEIDNETAKLSSIRADLEARRDRAQKIKNIASIVTGGALGVVGTALQFKSSTANLGNAIGVTGEPLRLFFRLLVFASKTEGNAHWAAPQICSQWSSTASQNFIVTTPRMTGPI